MPLHTPYCAESDFCVCWMEPQRRGLRCRKEAAIAVIGGGFAGLSVADQLINRYGFKNVTVYEALDRIGGRAHSVKFGQGYVELGAQYVQNLPNSIVLKMAQDLGVVPSQSSLLNLVNNRAKVFNRQTDLSLREGGSSVDQKLTNDFKKLLLRTEMEAAKGRLKLSHFPEHVKRSLGAVQAYEYSEWRLKKREHLTNDQTKDLDLLFKFATKAAELDYAYLLHVLFILIGIFFGCDDWHDVSLASTSQFYTVGESNDDFQLLPVDRRGYTALIDHLASKLPQNCVRLSSPCSSINWQGPRVDLDFEDGSSVTVEHVIITVPLGFLKRRALTFFSPPLPIAKKLSIEGLGVGTVEKLFARFEKQFWKNSIRRYELLWGEANEEESEEARLARSFFLLQPVQTSSNVVCLLTTGSAAKTVWKASEHTIKKIVQLVVLKFFPSVDENLAEPISILRSNWSGYKYFGGSYSYYSMNYDRHKHGPSQLAEPLYAQEDDTPLVLFAGEATCVHCYGTTHGALTSGHREARRLHLFYKKHSTDGGETLPGQRASCFGLQFKSWSKQSTLK